MYLKLINKNDHYDWCSGTVVLKPGDIVCLKDRQLHRKKKDQEQVELRELHGPASTGPGYSDL